MRPVPRKKQTEASTSSRSRSKRVKSAGKYEGDHQDGTSLPSSTVLTFPAMAFSLMQSDSTLKPIVGNLTIHEMFLISSGRVTRIAFVEELGILSTGMICVEYLPRRFTYVLQMDRSGYGQDLRRPMLQAYAEYLALVRPGTDLHVVASGAENQPPPLFRNAPVELLGEPPYAQWLWDAGFIAAPYQPGFDVPPAPVCSTRLQDVLHQQAVNAIGLAEEALCGLFPRGAISLKLDVEVTPRYRDPAVTAPEALSFDSEGFRALYNFNTYTSARESTAAFLQAFRPGIKSYRYAGLFLTNVDLAKTYRSVRQVLRAWRAQLKMPPLKKISLRAENGVVQEPPPSVRLFFERLPVELRQLLVRLVPDCHIVLAYCNRHFLPLFPLEEIDVEISAKSLCTRAAAEGNLGLLQWARAQGLPWDENTCSAAAESSLGVLKWACEHGCPLSWYAHIDAALAGRVDVLEWLRSSKAPLDWDLNLSGEAARRGHLAVVQWLVAQGFPLVDQTSCYAASEGHFEIVKWCRLQGGPWDEATCAFATGHLEILQWARANGCPWDEYTCLFAASGGHLGALKWARANGCPWNAVSICTHAAESGSIETLKWLCENGCAITSEASAKASNGGHFELLKWLFERGCILTVEASAGAAQQGHLPMLQWLRKQDCPWDERVCYSAAARGDQEMLQWAREHGCPWGSQAWKLAADNGHWELLKFLRHKGCPWDTSVGPLAAKWGRLDILNWLFEERFPWDEDMCAQAIKGGHLDVLQWLRQKGCPWDLDYCTSASIELPDLSILNYLFVQPGFECRPTLLGYAASAGHVDVLQWLWAKGCREDHDACAKAASEGRLEALKWLRENGIPWNGDVCLMAVKYEHLEVLEWCIDNGCPWDRTLCLKEAEEQESKDIVEWITLKTCGK